MIYTVHFVDFSNVVSDVAGAYGQMVGDLVRLFGKHELKLE